MGGTRKKTEKTKEQKIKSEKRKLNEIFKELDENVKKTVESLIEEAAFMAVSLAELQEKINEKGYTEEYQNGANQKGVKKSSEVEIYNTMIKNYMAVVKQRTDLIPKENKTKGESGDGFEEFVNGRED